MAISKTKKQLSTSTSGLRQSKPYSRLPVTETSTNAQETGFFPLKPTRYPPGTPITAVRSKKVYSDLVDERAFLQDIKEYWVEKLKDLKEDHKYLSRMKNVQKSQVLGVEPLFTREEEEPPQLRYPSLPSAAAAAEDSESNTRPTSPLLEENTGLSSLDQLKQLEVLFKNQYSDNEDNEGNEEDEEDEAKTREALSLLLQEFGDM